MAMRSSIGCVVGDCTDTHWAAVVRAGNVVGVVEAKDDDAGARDDGVRAVETLTERLSGNVTALSYVDDVIRAAWGKRMRSILLIVPIGNVVYVVLKGHGAAYLKRDGHIARLISAEGSMSGAVRAGDMFALASAACATALSPEEFAVVFDHLSAGDAAEKLNLVLHGKNEDDGAAAVLFSVDAVVNDDQEFPKALVVEPESEEESQSSPPSRGKSAFRMPAFPHLPSLPFGTRTGFLAMVKRRFVTTNFFVTAVIVLVLLVSVGGGLYHELSGKRENAWTKAITEAERVMQEGNALMDLNAVKGRERLEAALALLAPLKETASTKTKEGRRIIELYGEVSQSLARAMKVNDVAPELFFDVSLVKAGGRITAMAMDGETLVLLDAPGRTAYSLTVSPKNGAVIAGGDAFTGARYVSLSDETAYVVSTDAVHAIGLRDKKVRQGVIRRNAEWGTISGMAAFGGNLYLLDTGKSRIWKYVATAKGFSDMKEYLNPDTLPDLSKAVGFIIDGHVWMGSSDGKVMRYSQGKEYNYIPRGVAPPFGKNLIPFSSDLTRNIYILDRDNRRVVMLDKDGMYLSQYVWKAGFDPTDIAVSEKHGTILLLADGKLYGIGIK